MGELWLAGEPPRSPSPPRCLSSAEPRCRVKCCSCKFVRQRLPAVTDAASRPSPQQICGL